eukprot:1161733-Pelagomonas_calceolata.AAC.5
MAHCLEQHTSITSSAQNDPYLQDEAVCFMAQAGYHFVDELSRPEQRPKLLQPHAACLRLVLVRQRRRRKFLGQLLLDVPVRRENRSVALSFVYSVHSLVYNLPTVLLALKIPVR